MYSIDELNVRLLSELKEIADELGVKDFKKLNKQDLVYKILDQQAVTPEQDLPKKKKPAEAEEKEKKKPAKKKETTDELLESFDLNIDESLTSFDAPDEKKGKEKEKKKRPEKSNGKPSRAPKDADAPAPAPEKEEKVCKEKSFGDHQGV